MFDPYFTKMAISETPSNDFENFNDDIFHVNIFIFDYFIRGFLM